MAITAKPTLKPWRQSKVRCQVEVGAGLAGDGVGGDDEVGDVARRLAPLGDRLPRRSHGELDHGVAGDAQPRGERWRRAV
nr:unnamed protein product [Digitaria exilis]